MYLNNFVKAQSLCRIRLSSIQKDQLATKLVQLDETFKPTAEYPDAFAAYNSKGIISKSEWSQDFLAARLYLTPLLILAGILFYSYSLLRQRRETSTEFSEKDYKTLTLRQLRTKETSAQQAKQFDSILNVLQSKLKDEYQEQLHEFQDFVSSMESNKGNSS